MSGNTVILGTGIIGVSTAYYLSLSPNTTPQSIHLIEPSPKLFASASGYAAGFLAKDWFDPSAASLGALSFKLHGELAEEFGGCEKWGYANSNAFSLKVSRKEGSERGNAWLGHGGSRSETAAVIDGEDGETTERRGPDWLSKAHGAPKLITGRGSVAQIDPRRLCNFLLDKCLSSGVHLHHPAVAISVSKDSRDELHSIRLLSTTTGTETDLPVTSLVITAGAWTPSIYRTLFPSSTLQIPIKSLAGHTVIYRNANWSKDKEEGRSEVECDAVFTSTSEGWSPEIFSRLGGEIYASGLNSTTIPLPKLATDASPEPASIETMKKVARGIIMSNSPEKAELEVIRESVCFRPVTARGIPILCKIDDGDLGGGLATRSGERGGVWVAAGHGPWGITMSLGTGKVMAEMIEGVEVNKMSAEVGELGL